MKNLIIILLLAPLSLWGQSLSLTTMLRRDASSAYTHEGIKKKDTIKMRAFRKDPDDDSHRYLGYGFSLKDENGNTMESVIRFEIISKKTAETKKNLFKDSGTSFVGSVSFLSRELYNVRFQEVKIFSDKLKEPFVFYIKFVEN